MMNTSITSSVCRFCNENKAVYVCPKCNINYCSLDCYRNPQHIRCTEEFYHNWVKTCLESETADPTAREKMLDILKRIYGQDEEDPLDSDDDDEEPSLEARLADIDLSGDIDPSLLWSRLTDSEKKEFEEFITKGAEKIVPLWEPWWTVKKQPVLVEEISSSKEEPPSQDYPPIVQNIVPLTNLTKRPPSETVKNDVVNILYCYVFIARLYNGDHVSFCKEAVKILLSLSPVLSGNLSFPDVRHAIQYSLQKLITEKSLYTVSHKTAVIYIKDVILIIEGSTRALSFEYALRAFSDLKTLFSSARKEIKKDLKMMSEKADCETESTLKTVALSVKKIDYFLSWIAEFGTSLEEMLPLISIECASTLENMISPTEAEATVKRNKGPLIEELPS